MKRAGEAGLDRAGIDCVLDVRSIALEHWSYNVGVAREVLAARAGLPTDVIVSPDCAELMRSLGLPARERGETPSTGNRLLRLLAREWRAAVMMARALLTRRRVLLVHAHPLALCIAWPLLLLFGSRLAVCLHNDFIVAARGRDTESRIERSMWWIASRLNRRLQLVAPNRHYARFVHAFAPHAALAVLPHPVLARADYERVAVGSPLATGPRFALGFFGRVDPGRGAGDFRRWVEQHPAQTCVLVGRWTNRMEPLPNLEVVDLPDTQDYCALLLRADELFLDLRDDAYRIGESGVFWDAIALGARLRCGRLPRLYRERLRRPHGPPPDAP